MNDPDYSPAYQDEYQRLWHEARAEVVSLRQIIDKQDLLIRQIYAGLQEIENRVKELIE